MILLWWKNFGASKNLPRDSGFPSPRHLVSEIEKRTQEDQHVKIISSQKEKKYIMSKVQAAETHIKLVSVWFLFFHFQREGKGAGWNSIISMFSFTILLFWTFAYVCVHPWLSYTLFYETSLWSSGIAMNKFTYTQNPIKPKKKGILIYATSEL